ncbi:hypothetical protein HHI36_017871 [Cryptolaemus montrouzieri]|uniref:MYND-type domain-containing protein n=1 Tax=Cryptolaemus montrouzieri TaxID=559131 RepID=A0ABD2NP89_9CUCU
MKYLRKDIAPGSIIHSEKPFVYCLSSKVRTENCDFCFKKGMLSKCTSCKYVYYCDKVCQKEAWPVHKAECKSLKKVAPRIIPDAARMLARLIRKLNKNGNQVRSYYTEINFRMYKDLMSHYSDLKSDPKRMEHFETLCVVLNEFMNEDVFPNSVDLMGMFGRMCINSFNICTEEQQTLGTGMYLGASVLDHSCEPNALAMFQGTTLHIKALKQMSYLNWSEVEREERIIFSLHRNLVSDSRYT